jgi:hypothetical protein
MINIDFNVHSTPYWIYIADYSTWDMIEAQPSIVEISKPGYENPVTHYFDKSSTNAFNSINLRVNCDSGDCNDIDLVTLADGIYKIHVKGSPSKYSKERYYLKTDLLEMDIDKIVISSIDSGKYFEIEKDLVNIGMYFDGAHSNLRMDRIKEAGALYEQARKEVDRMLDCKDCYK